MPFKKKVDIAKLCYKYVTDGNAYKSQNERIGVYAPPKKWRKLAISIALGIVKQGVNGLQDQQLWLNNIEYIFDNIIREEPVQSQSVWIWNRDQSMLRSMLTGGNWDSGSRIGKFEVSHPYRFDSYYDAPEYAAYATAFKRLYNKAIDKSMLKYMFLYPPVTSNESQGESTDGVWIDKKKLPNNPGVDIDTRPMVCHSFISAIFKRDKE